MYKINRYWRGLGHKCFVYHNKWCNFCFIEVSIDDGCMLWNIKDNKLIFSCKTNDLQTPLSLFDNKRKERAKCIFEHNGNQIMRCSSRNKSRKVNVDVHKKEVRFTIHNFRSQNVDGGWKCVQGNRTFTSNVSILKGKHYVMFDNSYVWLLYLCII